MSKVTKTDQIASSLNVSNKNSTSIPQKHFESMFQNNQKYNLLHIMNKSEMSKLSSDRQLTEK